MAISAAAIAGAALALAACSPSNSNIQRPPAKPTSTSSSAAVASSTTTSSDLPAGTAATQQAVLNTWESAQKTYYAYMDEPPGPLRADLVAGETSTDLFPKLTDYYAQQALTSASTFLVQLKMASLNGPTSFNLGTPTVAALTATAATVSFCTSDTGTTTANGQPGPANLDGNNPAIGGVRGTSSLVLTGGSWMITSGQSVSVAKC